MRARELVQVVALGAFAALQAVGVFHATYPHELAESVLPERLVGLFVWKMFAPKDRTNWRVDFEGERDGAWEPLPMADWEPPCADGRKLWDKPQMLSRPSFRVPYLRFACARSGLPRVRAVWRSWPKIPGQDPYSGAVAREKVLSTWTCGT